MQTPIANSGDACVALIFAGGCGARMGASVPKQFLDILGKPVLAHTLAIFQSHPLVDRIRIVAQREWFARTEGICREFGITKFAGIAEGGETAQDSIWNGLLACAREDGEDAVVLVHDGVRPYVEADVVARNVEAVREFGNAVTVVPCFETIVLSRDGVAVDAMPRRAESYVAQAPQSFRVGDLLRAHEAVRRRPGRYDGMVDQATICKELGIPVHLVPGSRGNVKVTTKEDLLMLSALLAAKEGGRETA